MIYRRSKSGQFSPTDGATLSILCFACKVATFSCFPRFPTRILKFQKYFWYWKIALDLLITTAQFVCEKLRYMMIYRRSKSGQFSPTDGATLATAEKKIQKGIKN